MKALFALLSLLFLCGSFAFQASAEQMPFPMAAKLKHHRLAIPGYPQDTLNEDIKRYYDIWVSHYYKTYPAPHDNVGYIEGHVTGYIPEEWKPFQSKLGALVSASEHTGYGMILFAIMGDKEKFDSLVRLYRAFERKQNHLMGWVMTENFIGTIKGLPEVGTATDGDMDVAYALLMGEKQWPGQSPFDESYLQMARDMINKGVYVDLIHPDSKRIQLGDWHSDYAPYTRWVTRSSDFMLDNLRAFVLYADEDKKARFEEAIAEVYAVMDTFNKQHNNGTGLLSDFIVGEEARPAPPKFLHEDFPTGDYSENSCRLPFRLAVDYLHSGNEKTQAHLLRIANWIDGKVKSQWYRVVDSYKLNGDSGIDWDQAESAYHDHIGVKDGLESLQFASGLVASQIVKPGSEKALTAGWKYLSRAHAYGKTSRHLKENGKALPVQDGYFKDSLTLLNLMAISGNWWFPGKE